MAVTLLFFGKFMDKNCTFKLNLDIAKGNDSVRIAFYSNIGFFIEVAQMLEYNLRKLICYHLSVNEIEAGEINKENVIAVCKKYDEYYIKTYDNRLTLGKLVGKLEDCGILQEIAPFVREVNDYRIQVVHKIFQNNVVAKKFQEAENVRDYTEKRLVPMIDKAIETNDLLIKTIGVYREDLRNYKKQFDIPYEE